MLRTADSCSRHWTNRGRQKSKSKVAHTGNRKQRTSWSASPPVLASKVGGFSAGVDSPAAHPAASSFFWSIGAKNLKKTDEEPLWGVIFRGNPIDFFAPLKSLYCFGSNSFGRFQNPV